MKGIYKKISVGVLAAALLVGAGGIAQGGQAFADYFINVKHRISIDVNQEREYRKAQRQNDIDEGYDWYSLYARGSERLRVVEMLEKGMIKEAVELRIEKGSKVKVQKKYNDGWELKEAIKEKKLEGGKHIVEIGDNKAQKIYFEISL